MYQSQIVVNWARWADDVPITHADIMAFEKVVCLNPYTSSIGGLCAFEKWYKVYIMDNGIINLFQHQEISCLEVQKVVLISILRLLLGTLYDVRMLTKWRHNKM